MKLLIFDCLSIGVMLGLLFYILCQVRRVERETEYDE